MREKEKQPPPFLKHNDTFSYYHLLYHDKTNDALSPPLPNTSAFISRKVHESIIAHCMVIIQERTTEVPPSPLQIIATYAIKLLQQQVIDL